MISSVEALVLALGSTKTSEIPHWSQSPESYDNTSRLALDILSASKGHFHHTSLSEWTFDGRMRQQHVIAEGTASLRK